MSGVLIGIGTATVALNASKPHRMLAVIPLFFGAQQAAEGIVWLTLGDSRHAVLQALAVNAFLGFAVMVWPAWLPFSLRRLERDAAQKRMLSALCGAGAVFSATAAILLVHWQPWARLAHHSIAYDYQYSSSVLAQVVFLTCYVVPAVVPFFVSTTWLARTLGLTLVAAMGAAYWVQREALPSVWCFFAAILSALMLVVILRERRSHALGSAVG
jgi:hypothetical protein